MLTNQDRDTLALALAIGLECADDVPDLGLDFDDREMVMAVCRAIVNDVPEENARFYLDRLRAAFQAGLN